MQFCKSPRASINHVISITIYAILKNSELHNLTPENMGSAAALKLFRVGQHWNKWPIPHLQPASFTSPEQGKALHLYTTITVLLTTSFNRKSTTNSTRDTKKCETTQTWQTQVYTCYALTSETASFNRLCLGFLEPTGHATLSGTKHATLNRCHYEH